MESLSSCPYISDERLSRHAASDAGLIRPGKAAPCRPLLSALMDSKAEILRTARELEERSRDLIRIPSHFEWILDNTYIVKREYAELKRLFSSCPRLPSFAGSPAAASLALSLLRAGRGSLSRERIKLYLQGFQSVRPLSRAELYIFPALLRAEAIVLIAGVCRELKYSQEEKLHSRSLEALFASLHLLSGINTTRLMEECDCSAEILAHDPGGDFSLMDEATRQMYLSRLAKLARREGLSECELARRLIERAREERRHIGFYLFSPPASRRAELYIGFNILISLFFSLLPAIWLESPWAALLLLLPVSGLVKNLTDFVLTHSTAPSRLPRMDMSRGIPENGQSICVISALVCSCSDAERLCRRLEELSLSCRGGGRIFYALLADLPPADSEETARDAEITGRASELISTLNRRYGGGFYLFTRKRCFDGEKYCGYERKRGALMELCALLNDSESGLKVLGDRDALSSVKYIIALDSDTEVYPGAFSELIGAALHPLCRPVIDEKKGLVVSGHGIIQPRIATELSGANATDFALIFAGSGGSDPYGGLCSELYMDAFESGGFSGKGIIDAGAMYSVMKGRIPTGQVLSHDALEGAFLRSAFMGDTEFSDVFPSNPIAYFKRLHRWVRGDVQNIPWIFCSGLPPIERWRLFDSLRRCLTAPMTFISLLLAFFLPEKGPALAAWAALTALLSGIILSLAQDGLKPREAIPLRRYTRLLSGTGGAIVSSFMRLWLLPYEAWICLTALFTSLWRMLVSHKRLLQWQTAAQAESSGSGLAGAVRAMWPAAAAGLLLLIFSPLIIGKSAGILWLLSPICAAALALPAYKPGSLSADDREFLLRAAGENFRYFREFLSPYDNFLPPDNFQEEPPTGLAHRTSPTNIGLAMCSMTAACDMGIIGADEAEERIISILDSLERLPKFRGQLYNWYDTHSLAVLNPPLISSVDSGNLYACLSTVRQALLEQQRLSTAGRIKVLMDAMDFSFLYDPERCLFYICYDSLNSRGNGGYYDLMASEALLLSYIAIAKGDVSAKHWRQLSRAQLQQDGYRGLASWSGTMFEYMMPFIFLTLHRGSLLYESCRFCMHVQKKGVFPGKPWGISESAFYVLDGSLNYRYKANGCAALSLKRNQGRDMTVSPYSSFLALAAEPEAAVKNLRRLKLFGAAGRLGFMEALDFTPSRCRRDEGEKVRCYMAHHIGMSICSAANALCGGSIQRRFMADCAMSAHRLLLQERLPSDGIIIKRPSEDIPERPLTRFEGQWEKKGRGQQEGGLALMSNGIYSLLVSASGACASVWQDISIFSFPRLPFKGCPVLSISREGKKTCLLPGGTDSWCLGEDMCFWEKELSGLNLRHSLFTAAAQPGEIRCTELEPKEDMDILLTLSLRPVLARYADYLSHPAFWELGIGAESEEGRLILRRLKRGSCPELWLCIASERPLSFSYAGTDLPPYLMEPALDVQAGLSLKKGARESISLAISAAFSREEAIRAADEMLESPRRGQMCSACAARLGMSRGEYSAAMAMLKPLLSPISGAAPREELWKYGISGSRPIICCGSSGPQAMPALNTYCLYKSCGIDCELVYTDSEAGEYMGPSRRRIAERLALLGLESLISSEGGVRFVPAAGAAAAESRAALVFGGVNKRPAPLRLPVLSAARESGKIPEYRFENGTFIFDTSSALPPRAWQHILTNGRFGAIVSDCGAGCMWYENSREMRINEPPSSVRSVSGSEGLWISSGSERISLFAADDGRPSQVSYSPGLARWERELEGRKISLCAFIPFGLDARVFIIEGAEGLKLSWAIKPSLAPDASALRCSFGGGVFHAENPESSIEGISFSALSSSGAACSTNYCPPAMLMSMQAEKISVLVCGVCSAAELKSLCSPEAASAALGKTLKRWRQLLGVFRLKTQLPVLDNYLSFFAPYQAIACRLEGRSSLYQSGGAFGFRDQLQDSINMLLITPEYARERILDCCRHQYEQGDVMHWWHPNPRGDRGIRSRCSDDLLWLCWALCEYTEKTGDLSICNERQSFLSSPPLREGERDRYESPGKSEISGTVLEHAFAALELCLKRGLGPHGLPFFGSGDWNDGLDDVDGESVWLGWFFSICALRFSKLLKKLSADGASYYEALAERLGRAADSAWNGSFYLRGYYSDGSPLGGEERIDSLPQSFAAMCPYADEARVRKALGTALERLVDRRHKLVKLFDPPFSPDERSPGYITSYGEGFRENGGQYTHAAVWLASACFKKGLYSRGEEIMLMLLPENRDISVYEAEPYVLAADVYSAPGHEGRAGWSWYTGSAGWYFKTALQDMLGIELKDGRLCLNCPPSAPGFSLVYTDAAGREIRLEHPVNTESGGK